MASFEFGLEEHVDVTKELALNINDVRLSEMRTRSTKDLSNLNDHEMLKIIGSKMVKRAS